MKYLVSDTVLDQYTWCGTIKLDAFQNLVNINNLLFRSVREQFETYKRSAFNKYMVEWLKHSSTRQRTVIYKYPEHIRNRNYNDGDVSDHEIGDDENGDNENGDNENGDDENDEENGNEYGDDGKLTY